MNILTDAVDGRRIKVFVFRTSAHHWHAWLRVEEWEKQLMTDISAANRKRQAGDGYYDATNVRQPTEAASLHSADSSSPRHTACYVHCLLFWK